MSTSFLLDSDCTPCAVGKMTFFLFLKLCRSLPQGLLTPCCSSIWNPWNLGAHPSSSAHTALGKAPVTTQLTSTAPSASSHFQVQKPVLPPVSYGSWEGINTVAYLGSVPVLDLLILSEEVFSHRPQNFQGLNFGLAFISLELLSLFIQL